MDYTSDSGFNISVSNRIEGFRNFCCCVRVGYNPNPSKKKVLALLVVQMYYFLNFDIIETYSLI